MPLPEPRTDKLVRWKPEVKPPKGYYIARIHEGINPVTGFLHLELHVDQVESDRAEETAEQGKEVLILETIEMYVSTTLHGSAKRTGKVSILSVKMEKSST